MTLKSNEQGGVEIVGETPADALHVISPAALEFVAGLQRTFNPTRERLLGARLERQKRISAGERPGLLAETKHIRAADWRVVAPPPALSERHVEITGPVDRKMMINAFNSGASCFMADFEDSLSPTWPNVVRGQANLMEAVRGSLAFTSPEGRTYTLGSKVATLLVRPRGWHLVERHVRVDGKSISASVLDFGLHVFHNAKGLKEQGKGPFFYLAKLESHLEARLWNDVFVAAEDGLGLNRGTFRGTVLIETILAAFEMDEVLYELRDHSGGLNAGRWDYIFSIIKKFRDDPAFVLPDRAQVTMGVPFMRAYAERLVRTCHRRGAQAIGGMAAFIPSRRDEAVNRKAIAKVEEDKQREARQGFDGTWVAHPDLVSLARQSFESGLGPGSAQSGMNVDDDTSQLLDVRVPGGAVTAHGVRTNVRVALEYLAAWLAASGAVGIDNLMEDTATAEISRGQLWQWRRHGVPVDGGAPLTRDGYKALRAELLESLSTRSDGGRWLEAAELLDELVLSDTFIDFVTLPGARYLDPDVA